MLNEKGLYLLLLLIITVSLFVCFKNFFIRTGIMEKEHFTSSPTYSADFSANIGGGKCRCQNGQLGDVSVYLDADSCVCDPLQKDRDRPELSPGELGQQYRNRTPFYNLNCHLSHEYDAHVDITQPYKPNSGDSKPMKFQTFKKNAYIPCTSGLNHENTYEEQYKKSIQSQTKRLQDKPYLYTRFKDDKYFENWSKK
jgi:hypothetical protein